MTVLRRLLDRKGRDVLTIDPDDTVLDAIKAMAARDIGGLVVVEKARPSECSPNGIMRATFS
jgi:CBS domain-containing protein